MPRAKHAVEDDFVLTLSDNEDDLEAPEVILSEGHEEPSKKRKRELEPVAKQSKKTRKEAKVVVDEQSDDEEQRIGVWGAKADDDGAMDSDFEFQLEADAKEDLNAFDGWGFEGARKGLPAIGHSADHKAADIDELVRRRRKVTGLTGTTSKADTINNVQTDDAISDDDIDGGMTVDLDEDDDEGLGQDGFGMGVGSDEEESGLEDEEEDATDQEVSADESDDAAIGDDMNVEDESEVEDATPDRAESDGEDGDDAEEVAKQQAFFAPDEPQTTKSIKSSASFNTMNLSRPIHRGLAAVGFSQPTPIQAKTIPVALLGKDVVGGAVTGSGKTGAFIVPILERLLYRPKKVPTTRVVILMPTRELAIQCHAVATKLASFTDIKFCLAVGGLSLKVQEAELRLRPDVVIATPGRFIDHMRNSASFTTDTLEILVLDEADRMLEDGFADELNEILATIPKSRQTMLFSATMTNSVDKLVRVGMNRPVRLMVDAKKQTAGTLVQEFVRLRPGREGKRMGYLLYLCSQVYQERVIVFFRQKKEAHRARIIFALSGLKAGELHGSLSQEQRITSVEAFRDGKVAYLLCTDLASRGLDIKGVDTVINYEAPQSHEIYLHRVGRTARAGRSGRACTLAAEPDRKVVKIAVKSGRAQGAKIASRVIEASEADAWAAKVDAMADEIEEIVKEEKEEKQLAQADMQLKRGENIILHENEIKGRPKRTWFESEADKRTAKKAGRAELNGADEIKAKKGVKRLSNKDKKKLDAHEERKTEHIWKKGKAERAGKGAVENLKKEKKGGRAGGAPNMRGKTFAKKR